MNKLSIISNQKVRQSNHLIESPYAQEFSVHEIKLFEIAIASFVQDDMNLYYKQNNKQFSLSNSELASLLHTSTSVISQKIENTAKRIMKKMLHLRKVLEDGSIEFEMINIIPYAQYKNGILNFEINYKVIPSLIDVSKNFTEYQVNYLLTMNSAYSVKLYKLLYQYKKIKSRMFRLEDLKEQFGLLNKYPHYNNFKERILMPSIIDINARTDLIVSFNEIKFGRKIHKIEFKFETQLKEVHNDFKMVEITNIENKLLSDVIIDSNNIKKDTSVISFGLVPDKVIVNTMPEALLQTISNKISPITKQILNNFYKDKGKNYITASIEYAEENAKTNFDKYLQDTLKNGWCIAKLNKIQEKIEKEVENKQIEEKTLLQQKKQEEQRQLKQKQIKESFLQLPLDERNNIVSELVVQISKAVPEKINEILVEQEEYAISFWAIRNNINYNGKLQLSLKSWLRLY